MRRAATAAPAVPLAAAGPAGPTAAAADPDLADLDLADPGPAGPTAAAAAGAALALLTLTRLTRARLPPLLRRLLTLRPALLRPWTPLALLRTLLAAPLLRLRTTLLRPPRPLLPLLRTPLALLTRVLLARELLSAALVPALEQEEHHRTGRTEHQHDEQDDQPGGDPTAAGLGDQPDAGHLLRVGVRRGLAVDLGAGVPLDDLAGHGDLELHLRGEVGRDLGGRFVTRATGDDEPLAALLELQAGAARVAHLAERHVVQRALGAEVLALVVRLAVDTVGQVFLDGLLDLLLELVR